MNYLRNNTTSYSLINVSISQNSSLVFPIDCSRIHAFCVKDSVLLDSVFVAFLRQFVALESLEFSNLQIVRTQLLEPTMKIIHRNIKDINFEFSSWEIFDYLYTPSLSSLRLSSSDLSAHKQITNFLSEVNDLKKLELHAVSCDIMKFFGEFQFSFVLKDLILMSSDYTDQIDTRYDINFQEFISAHATSLTTLEMRALLTPSSLDFLVNKLRNLRKVHLKINHLICDTTIYYQKKPRKNVRNLTLEGSFHSIDMVVTLMSLFPCTKSLYLLDSYMDFNVKFLSQVLRYASIVLPELNELSVSRLIPLEPDVIFDRLEILRIGYVNDWNELATFISTNFTIQRLYIDHVFRYQTNQKAIKMLVNSHIMHLYMTADIYEIKRIYDFIEDIGNGNLMTLELIVKSHESKSYHFNYSMGNINPIVAEQLKFDTNAFIIDDLVEYLDETQNDDSPLSLDSLDSLNLSDTFLDESLLEF